MPHRRAVVAASTLILAAAAIRAQQPGSAAEPAAAPAFAGRLRAVRIVTGDVFDDETADRRPIAALINALHRPTRTEVIECECWLRPGDPVTAAQAAEFERNLRRLGLFAEVKVRLEPTGTDGEVDMVVTTRDRMSLFFGGGGSYVGGVSGFNFAVGDNNLLGSGDSLAASFRRNSVGDYRGQLSYRELHLLDSWVSAGVAVQRTDDGDGASLQLDRSFHHLADPMAWNASASAFETAQKYYLDGNDVAEVPLRLAALGGEVLWADGPDNARDIRGLVLAVDRRSYDPARGPLATDIRVPGDTQRLYVGGRAQWDRVDAYRKVTGLDTIDYVQDLTLGTTARLAAGLRLRDEDGIGLQPEPEFSAGAAWSAEPIDDLFVHLGAAGSGRFYAGTAQAWSASARAQAFWLAGAGQTLGVSTTLDLVEERQDLPPQLLLGEDSGLRGYSARQFVGKRRLRCNVEHRTDTGLELWTLRFGVAAFADLGQVGDGGTLGRPYRGAGVGLRVGSVPLLGAGVVRIDLAWPFDAVPGEPRDWSVSVSLGQVFGFGGNASGL